MRFDFFVSEIFSARMQTSCSRYLLYVTALASLLAIEVPTIVDAAMPPRRIQLCDSALRDFLRFFCGDKDFVFPFNFSRGHLVRRYKAPSNELYPYQHQAAMCCKAGCVDHEFQRMCRYNIAFDFCGQGVNLKTEEGLRGRANCLKRAARLSLVRTTFKGFNQR